MLGATALGLIGVLTMTPLLRRPYHHAAHGDRAASAARMSAGTRADSASCGKLLKRMESWGFDVLQDHLQRLARKGSDRPGFGSKLSMKLTFRSSLAIRWAATDRSLCARCGGSDQFRLVVCVFMVVRQRERCDTEASSIPSNVGLTPTTPPTTTNATSN